MPRWANAPTPPGLMSPVSDGLQGILYGRCGGRLLPEPPPGAAEVARLALEVQPLATARRRALTQLGETLATTALTASLDGVEQELDAADEPWTCAYSGSELERLQRAAVALSVTADEGVASSVRLARAR